MSEMILRTIPGCPGYLAGADGTIWSEMPGRGARYTSLHQLRPHFDKQGYLRLSLGKRGGGRLGKFSVHALVALAFIGPRPDDMVVRHHNGQKTDNRSENIRYGTQAENIADKREHGTQTRGERHPRATISDDQAREVIRRALAGERITDVAREYGVTVASVWSLKNGRTRRHLAIAPMEISA
jgi:hypothetical protein